MSAIFANRKTCRVSNICSLWTTHVISMKVFMTRAPYLRMPPKNNCVGNLRSKGQRWRPYWILQKSLYLRNGSTEPGDIAKWYSAKHFNQPLWLLCLCVKGQGHAWRFYCNPASMCMCLASPFSSVKQTLYWLADIKDAKCIMQNRSFDSLVGLH